jgi:hypothetical protein
MATSSSPGGRRSTKTTKNPTRRSTASTNRRRSNATTARSSNASTSTSTQPRTPVQQAQAIAQRAVLVPVGASLLARDNLVSTVRGLATKYRTRAGLERELKRYERRGASARNRFERQVRRTRTRFERELRHRRSNVERTVRQNRRRFEREVRSVRKDLEKQSGVVGARVERLVSNAQGLINNSAS